MFPKFLFLALKSFTDLLYLISLEILFQIRDSQKMNRISTVMVEYLLEKERIGAASHVTISKINPHKCRIYLRCTFVDFCY